MKKITEFFVNRIPPFFSLKNQQIKKIEFHLQINKSKKILSKFVWIKLLDKNSSSRKKVQIRSTCKIIGDLFKLFHILRQHKKLPPFLTNLVFFILCSNRNFFIASQIINAFPKPKKKEETKGKCLPSSLIFSRPKATQIYSDLKFFFGSEEEK